MKKIIFGNSKFRLVLAILAISLMMIGCGNSTEPTDNKPIEGGGGDNSVDLTPIGPSTPIKMFTLATVPTTLPTENVWVIADGGSPTTADFDKLETLLNSDAAKNRKITLNFSNIEAIPAEAFFNTTSGIAVKTIVAVSAEKATTIGANAFSRTALTTATFPMATTIGDGAFGNCPALTTASFPKATTIVDNAFYQCTALTTASFPKATTIGVSAFYQCTALTTASFPVATTIGYGAFGSCAALTTMEIATGSTLGTIPSTAFDGTTDTANITVTTSAANKSKFEANGWQFKFL